MTLYQEDGKTKLSVRKGIGYSLKHNTSSVKHGEGNLIVWLLIEVAGGIMIVCVQGSLLRFNQMLQN